MSTLFDVIGHRGEHVTHPENTMAAFEHALRCGADGLECDVRLTRDGIPVVIHDDELERTTDGVGTVSEHTAAELASVDAGGTFDPKFKGERIPLLEDLLQWAMTNDLQLHLELKPGPRGNPRLVDAVTEMISSSPLLDRILMSSFHHGSLVQARESIPSLNVGLLYWYGLYQPGKYARELGAATLNCHWKAVDRELVEDARANDVGVLAFTVWTEDEVRAIASTGLRGMITADAEMAVNVRSRLESEFAA